jgi:hypothetical protein
MYLAHHQLYIFSPPPTVLHLVKAPKGVTNTTCWLGAVVRFMQVAAEHFHHPTACLHGSATAFSSVNTNRELFSQAARLLLG